MYYYVSYWHCFKSAQYLSTVHWFTFIVLTCLLCHYVTCSTFWCWNGLGVRGDYEKTVSIHLFIIPPSGCPSCYLHCEILWQLWLRLHVIFQPSSMLQPLGLNVDLGRSCRDYFYWGMFSKSVMGSLVETEKPGSDIPTIESWNLICLFQVI